MEWIYVKNELPLAYETGDWDGKRSEQIIVEDKLGNKYLAHYYEGILDGCEFTDWVDNRDYIIDIEVVRWIKIPY